MARDAATRLARNCHGGVTDMTTYTELASVTLKHHGAQSTMDMLLGFARRDYEALHRFHAMYHAAPAYRRDDIRRVMARRLATYQANIDGAANLARIAGVVR